MPVGLGPILASSLERAPWGYVLTLIVLLALIRAWPMLAQRAEEARAALRKNNSDTLAGMNMRLTLLEGKVEAANTVAHNAEMKLVSALAAYRLIASELQKLCPDSPILRQAQELLNVSYPAPRGPSPADMIRQTEKMP